MSINLETYGWFKDGFNSYNPIPETLESIKDELKFFSIDIIIDVDCKDVQFLIPKLIKTFYLCGFEKYKINNINMKKLPVKLDDNPNLIEKVPTIIFEKFGLEQFRVAEKMFNCSRIEKEIEYLLVTMIVNNKPSSSENKT